MRIDLVAQICYYQLFSVSSGSSGRDLSQITEMRAAEDDLRVIAQLREGGQPAAQATTRASDQVVVNAPADLDVRTVIVGQRPQGISTEHRFVESATALDQIIPQGGRVL
jgi:hypothetical protein